MNIGSYQISKKWFQWAVGRSGEESHIDESYFNTKCFQKMLPPMICGLCLLKDANELISEVEGLAGLL
jgi:hypothetical protein